MKKTLPRYIALLVLLLSATSVFGQNPNYDPGPVWRVTYFNLKPGMGDAFWKDFREHGKPVLDEFKKQGFISDYKLFTNFTADGPHDWDIAVGVSYPNYAAMDQLDAKGATVVVKHYGSREAMLDAAKRRAEIREVVASKVAREVIPK